MVKELNELVWYAEKSLWRDEAMLSFLCKDRPEVKAIYSALQKQHYRTDDEAAKASDMSLTSFKKYGKLLREHLRDMVFFYNDEKTRADPRLKNLFEGIKDLAAMRLLYARGCRAASRDAAEDLLKKGLLYEWPEFVQQAALYLKECVLRVTGSEKEFEHYSELYWTYKNFTDLENKAWDYLQRAQLPYRRKAGLRSVDTGRMRQNLAELKPHVFKVPSVMFHIYYFLLRNYDALERSDYQELLKSCNAALQYLEGKPYDIQNPKAVFYYMKVIAYTYLGKYEEGHEAAEAGLALAAEGTASWFSALEVYLYLAIHTRKYDKAFDLYHCAVSHRRLSALHEAQQETWHILGAYCYILYRLTGTPLPVGFPKFKSRKFLNEINTFTGDKTGMNIAILIAHIMLQLIENKDVEVWDRIQALAKYRERYLIDNSFVERSEIFFKILMVLVKSGFRRDIFRSRMEPYLHALHKLPLQLTNQVHELEIIPYEHLVQLISSQLINRYGLSSTLPVAVMKPMPDSRLAAY